MSSCKPEPRATPTAPPSWSTCSRAKAGKSASGPVTEILQHREKGLKLVGPLPSEVQNYTSYSAVPMTAAANAELARVFVRYLGSPEGKALFVAAGVD